MEQKRKNIRFTSDDNAIAWLSVNADEFQEDHVALVDEESYKGCRLTFNRTPPLKVKDICMIKMRDFGPLKSELRWMKEIPETNLIVMGFQYLE